MVRDRSRDRLEPTRSPIEEKAPPPELEAAYEDRQEWMAEEATC